MVRTPCILLVLLASLQATGNIARAQETSAVPPIPQFSVGPVTPFTLIGPDYGVMNDVTPPLITLSDGSGFMGIYSAEHNSRFVGADLNHLFETDQQVKITDAPGDSGAWHRWANTGWNLFWFATLAYATDGAMVGFAIGNQTKDYGLSSTDTWNGVGVSYDQGKSWQLLGQIPAGGLSVVPAPPDSGFYWYTIGDTAVGGGPLAKQRYDGTGDDLFASKDKYGAPGSWYGWAGPNTWVPIDMNTVQASVCKPLPSLNGAHINWNCSLIIEHYLAEQSGHDREYLLTGYCDGNFLGWVSYDCINWSAPFTIKKNTGGQYYRIWGQGGTTYGGQDIVFIWQAGNWAPYTSRNMVQAAIHFGPSTAPTRPVIRDAFGGDDMCPSIHLSWTGAQAQSFTIYRRPAGGDFQQIATVPAGGCYTDYVDDSVGNGGYYYYYVTATSDLGTSPKSNVVGALASAIATSYTIYNAHTHDYLDASNATAPGSPLVYKPLSNSDGQRWFFGRPGNGEYTIISPVSGLVVGFDPKTGRIVMQSPTGDQSQIWKVGPHAYRYSGFEDGILNASNGKSLADPDKNDEPFLTDYKGYWNEYRHQITPVGPTAGPGLVDASFETPTVPATGCIFGPAYCGWTFTPLTRTDDGGHISSGITATGGQLNAPDAPDGEQCAFIEQTGAIEQTAFFQPGSYRVRLLAAQAPGAEPPGQTLSLAIDGKPIGTVTPTGTTFAPYSFPPFTIDAPSKDDKTPRHTIKIAGTATSDNRLAFLDLVRVVPANAGY